MIRSIIPLLAGICLFTACGPADSKKTEAPGEEPKPLPTEPTAEQLKTFYTEWSGETWVDENTITTFPGSYLKPGARECLVLFQFGETANGKLAFLRGEGEQWANHQMLCSASSVKPIDLDGDSLSELLITQDYSGSDSLLQYTLVYSVSDSGAVLRYQVQSKENQDIPMDDNLWGSISKTWYNVEFKDTDQDGVQELLQQKETTYLAYGEDESGSFDRSKWLEVKYQETHQFHLKDGQYLPDTIWEPQYASDDAMDQFMIGRHALRVNRIGHGGGPNWSARIGKYNGEYFIKAYLDHPGGDHSEPSNITITGKISSASKSRFKMEGTISGVSDKVMGAENCLMEGNFTFKTKGGRDYWRLYGVNGNDNCPCTEKCNCYCYIDVAYKEEFRNPRR